MKRFHLLLAAVAVLAAGRLVLAHCEIPCGIYGDRTRIVLLEEDIRTVEKSMQQIAELAGKSRAQDVNQVVRWIANKDDHAGRIQETVTQYFMTQRVKPAADEAGHAKYVRQITTLHEMLLAAMKCKQTVDAANCARLRELLAAFSEAYFTPEDLKHLREHHEQEGG